MIQAGVAAVLALKPTAAVVRLLEIVAFRGPLTSSQSKDNWFTLR